ncbi:MAG: putative chromosome segregation protein [Bacilli bacterium]|nr:putative chromosome segregation protein [Bacilli bacterium]
MLYKKHVRGIWDPSWSNENTINQDLINSLLKEKELQGLNSHINELTDDLKKAQLKIGRITTKLEFEVSRSNVYKTDYETLKKENELLLYKYLELLRSLHARDINIADLTTK